MVEIEAWMECKTFFNEILDLEATCLLIPDEEHPFYAVERLYTHREVLMQEIVPMIVVALSIVTILLILTTSFAQIGLLQSQPSSNFPVLCDLVMYNGSHADVHWLAEDRYIVTPVRSLALITIPGYSNEYAVYGQFLDENGLEEQEFTLIDIVPLPLQSKSVLPYRMTYNFHNESSTLLNVLVTMCHVSGCVDQTKKFVKTKCTKRFALNKKN